MNIHMNDRLTKKSPSAAKLMIADYFCLFWI
jgi:hypothetical protein